MAYNIEVIGEKGSLSDAYIKYKLQKRQEKQDEEVRKKVQRDGKQAAITSPVRRGERRLEAVDFQLDFNLQFLRQSLEKRKQSAAQHAEIKRYVNGWLVGPEARRKIFLRTQMAGANRGKKKGAIFFGMPEQ